MQDNKTKMIEYITSRGIEDPFYLDLLKRGFPHHQYCLCSAYGYDFMVSHFFDESDNAGCGLIPSNHNLHSDLEHQVAIGLVEGDDAICIDLNDGSINLWLVENGNGEHITLAPNFTSFWEMIVQ